MAEVTYDANLAKERLSSEVKKQAQTLIKEQLDLKQEELENLSANKPEHPVFPVHIFMMAVMKDLLDILTLGIVGIIANVVVGLVLWFWILGKMNFMKRWIWRRFILYVFIEFIPFISFIPIWTFFVARAHLREYEQIDKILTYIEERYLEKFA
jgi:hypothetical protein